MLYFRVTKDTISLRCRWSFHSSNEKTNGYSLYLCSSSCCCWCCHGCLSSGLKSSYPLFSNHYSEVHLSHWKEYWILVDTFPAATVTHFWISYPNKLLLVMLKVAQWLKPLLDGIYLGNTPTKILTCMLLLCSYGQSHSDDSLSFVNSDALQLLL